MANFSTHFSVAAGVALMGSTTYFSIHAVTAEEAAILCVAGTLGGILPDVDSDYSRPLQIVFTGLYMVFVFSLLRGLPRLSILDTWLMLGGLYVLFRHALLPAFRKWTVHRGIFHSILAALFFGLLASSLLFWLYGFEPGFSWLTGVFVFVGYIAHLLLDEFYSVDFDNKRLKSSWGTAFKLANAGNWRNTFLFLLGTVCAYQLTPPAHDLSEFVLNKKHYEAMWQKFLPEYLPF